MSITQGMTGGGSWSGRRTLRAFPTGAGYRSLGRGNFQLLPGVSNTELAVLLLLAPLSTTGVAARLGITGLRLVTRPMFWAAVNAYQEASDLAAWARGDPMSWQVKIKFRPISKLGPLSIPGMYGIPAIPLPFPYLDFTKSPSSGVGGPGEIPNIHRPPLSMEETGKLISNPPMVGDVPSSPRRSSSKKRRKKRKCPKGHYWSDWHQSCIPRRGVLPYWQKEWLEI